MSKCQDKFVDQIRDALAHLYDYAYLQRHALAQWLTPQASATRAQELRRTLLEAIEALNPGDSVPIRAAERRPYAILFGLYVEGRPQSEVANQLGIGSRQLRRDRKVAFEALASILGERYPTAVLAPESSPVAWHSLQSETERLAQQREPMDLADLVQGLLLLLEGMAREHGVSLLSHVSSGLPQPYENRTLMRQILINLASQALANLPLVRLSLEAQVVGKVIRVGLRLHYRQSGPPTPRLAAQSIEPLVAMLGGSLRQEVTEDTEESAWILLPVRDESVVLVVDDNQELFALFQRYVVGQPYRLIHAANTTEALALAHSQSPAMITLDLMMPGRDGWDLLQALRSDPATAHTPVIICSVLDESELALSLGAQVCLKKPVGQADLLRALEATKMLA